MKRFSLAALAAVLLLAQPVTSVGAEKTMTTSTGIELVWIPPGEFMMGTPAEDREWAAAHKYNPGHLEQEGGEPQKTKIAEGFWMGRTEVTVGQWRRFAEATGYATEAEKKGEAFRAPSGPSKSWQTVKGASWKDLNFGFKLKDTHPACCITWNDAVAFCEWLTETEKKASRLPASMVYRLPTEAEWENACRAGTKTKFWWGDTVEDGNDRLNWEGKEDGFEFVSPVDHFGKRGRNKFGLADMLGNVMEWCLDDFDRGGPHQECYKGGNSAVLRGGSFGCMHSYSCPAACRCSSRYPGYRNATYAVYGFRLACAPVPSTDQVAKPAPSDTAKAKTTKDDAPRPPRVAGTVDAEAQKDAKKFARNQASIKGLYVIRTEAGLRVGGAQDIIATAERASGDRETICDFVGEVGKDTQISMEEAERLLKVRYPVWQAGHKIRFSYSNKYSKQGGGSAGGAFSVLLLSLLDGVPIDPGFAMTGDVTVDGKIREVGAVPEKIRGALLEKCTTVALPAANKEDLNDLALLYSPAMLWSVQLFSIATLEDAAAVARTDRAANLAKAMEMFGQVQRSLGPGATAFALRSPGVVATLQQVLKLAPNHLSAEFMLRAAGGRMPQTLSLGGSLEEIWAAAGPLLGFLFSDYKEPEKSKRYYFDKVPTATFKAGMDRLNWLQMRLHPKTVALKVAMADYMTSLDQMHRASSFSAGALKQHLAKRDKVLSEAHTLGTDRKTLEEMMH